MTKVLLINFQNIHIQKDLDKIYTFENIMTNWSADQSVSLDPQGSQIVFYKANHTNMLASSLHTGDSESFIKFVKEGGVIVCLIGDCKLFHIKNLIGCPERLSIGGQSNNGSNCSIVSHSIFNKIFSIYGDYIGAAKYLGGADKSYPDRLDFNSDYAIIAVEGQNGPPISVYSKLGKGFYLFLPMFGDPGLLVNFILKEILPEAAPHLFYDPKHKWLEKEKYLFPNLIKLQDKRKNIDEDYKKKLQEIASKINEVKEKEQQRFSELLIKKGDDLKNNVKDAFEYLGLKVIDVDKHYQENDPERQMEEDLWLFYKNKKINIKKDQIILVEVKGKDKGSATDGDCTAVGKYVRRRIKEFGHQNIKGLFVINHFIKTEAEKRKSAYQENQIKDAVRDGDLLITTYDLYNLIKAEKEGKKSKKEIRELIINETGLLSFKGE